MAEADTETKQRLNDPKVANAEKLARWSIDPHRDVNSIPLAELDRARAVRVDLDRSCFFEIFRWFVLFLKTEKVGFFTSGLFPPSLSRKN